MGENPRGEYLCSLSVKITAENTANLFSGLYLNSRICSNKISCFFLLFSIHRGIFSPWGKYPMGFYSHGIRKIA